jgi:uncharacterized membrane protein
VKSHPISPRVVVVLLLALGLVGCFARPAVAADWAVKPADNAFGTGRQDYRYTLNPGGRAEDGLTLVNTGPAPLRLTLRADGLKWLTIQQAAVTVPAGGSLDVPFTVALPEDAAPGDHVGALVAEAAGTRAVIPLDLRVGGPLKPRLAVEHVQINRSGGDATVTYTVRNTGNATLGAHPSVALSGPFGRFSAKVGTLADAPPLAPGRTWTGTAHADDVTPALRLTATVEVFPLLTDAAGSTTPLPAVKVTGHAVVVPWLLVVAVLGLGGVGLSYRRRSRHALKL